MLCDEPPHHKDVTQADLLPAGERKTTGFTGGHRGSSPCSAPASSLTLGTSPDFKGSALFTCLQLVLHFL